MTFKNVDAALRKEKPTITRNMNHRRTLCWSHDSHLLCFFLVLYAGKKKLQTTDTMLQQPQSKIDVDIRRMARVYEYFSLF
jgi:hypothetical protein